jgi:hypothetical protein
MMTGFLVLVVLGFFFGCQTRMPTQAEVNEAAEIAFVAGFSAAFDSLNSSPTLTGYSVDESTGDMTFDQFSFSQLGFETSIPYTTMSGTMTEGSSDNGPFFNLTLSGSGPVSTISFYAQINSDENLKFTDVTANGYDFGSFILVY